MGKNSVSVCVGGGGADASRHTHVRPAPLWLGGRQGLGKVGMVVNHRVMVDANQQSSKHRESHTPRNMAANKDKRWGARAGV